jgi:hypothetical protein
VLFFLLGAAMSAAIETGAFWRADNIAYDLSVPRGSAPADIVIVAIDDASVAELGRWPWRRATLALGLERLAALAPKSLVLDVLLLERDAAAPEDDQLLASAIAAGPPTVLPLSLEIDPRNGALQEVLPIAPLRAAAAGIGHVHLEIDRDGIARSVFLREGLNEARWPHLALAALESLGESPRGGLRGERNPSPHAATAVWRRDYRVLIPFLGPPGHFRQVSFADVLRGSIAPEVIRGRMVLLGATAQGLGDAYPTGRSGQSRAMPGVEITANVLAMLQSGVLLRQLPAYWQHLISWLVLLGAFGAFLWLTPRGALLLVGSAVVAVAALASLLLRGFEWWFPPVPLLAALASAYPLWSWRRLEATQRYLEEELAQVAAEPDPITALTPQLTPAAAERFGDRVERRIDLARHATARLRALRKFLWSTIANLPDATLAIRADGRIALANARAAALLGAASAETLQGRDASEALAAVLANGRETLANLAARAPCAIEIRTHDGRDLLVGLAPFEEEANAGRGVIVEIADVTALKRALRERQDLMRFLSHDMRSPASSLLSLARLQQAPEHALPNEEFARQTESLAARSLALTDGFLALARAEAASARDFELVNLTDLVRDARDEIWANAEVKQIELMPAADLPVVWVNGSRDLLTRAVVNLGSNAIKYTQRGGRVELALEQQGTLVGVTVSDNGPGIAVDRQSGLFVPFQRAIDNEAPDPGGLGLGLAFVRMVADKHGGRCDVQSAPGEGATFRLWLPAAAAPNDADG